MDPADPSQWNLSSTPALCGRASPASAAHAAGACSQARTAAGAHSSWALAALPADAARRGSGGCSIAGRSSSEQLAVLPADAAGAGAGSAAGPHRCRAGEALTGAPPAGVAYSDAVLGGSNAPPHSGATTLSAGAKQVHAVGRRSGGGAAPCAEGATLPGSQLLTDSRGPASADGVPATAEPASASAPGGAAGAEFWVDPYVGGSALRPRAQAGPRTGGQCMHVPAAATHADDDALQADTACEQRTGNPAIPPSVAKQEQEPAHQAAAGCGYIRGCDISQLFEGMEDGDEGTTEMDR